MKSTEELKKNETMQYPIVVIGASFGGIEAIKDLLKSIPERPDMTFIIIMHLQADYKKLHEKLAPLSAIPIKEISNKLIFQKNKIYIVPFNKVLVANEQQLHLIERSEQYKLAIDISFSSIAQVHKKCTIGIVLSGNGQDGTQGLAEIKKQGGFTIVQSLKSAICTEMSQSAIDANIADYVLSPGEMMQKLKHLKQTLELKNIEDKIEEERFQQIYAKLLLKRNVDFSYYKQSTIRRRIQKRMGILKLDKVSDYLEYLQNDKAEQDRLFDELLIPVTEFFRDSHVFENIENALIPNLLKAKSANMPLRIWVVGCSTGQEAYSLAMAIQESIGTNNPAIKFQILATDISEKSIAKAKTGNYLNKEIKGISEERLARFFIKSKDGYQINKEIRDTCIFACHNFFKDTPFAKIDLISCRNVLIYMNAFLQEKAFNIFHYALNTNGFLLLGKSESSTNSSELFVVFDKRNKIYTPKAMLKQLNFNSDNYNSFSKYNTSNRKFKATNDFEGNANEILLAQYTPSGVIVNEHFEIVQFRGSSDPYLAPAQGNASLNILKMVQEGLAFELNNILLKVKTSNKPVKKERIPTQKRDVSITIEAIPLLNTEEQYILILFIKEAIEVDLTATTPNELATKKDQRIQELEQEIRELRKDMNALYQTQEALNEELSNANGTLLNDSEILKNLNEELEISTEELLSSNEELITVNEELFERNNQLNSSRSFAESVIKTLHEPLILLDKKHKILNANLAFYKVFKLKETEVIGKVLFQLQGNRWNIEGLKKSLNKIQKKKEEIINIELTHFFPSIGMRTICFNMQSIPSETEEPLTVLAFEDLTDRIKLEQNSVLLKERHTLYDFFMEASGAFCILNGPEHTFEYANPVYCKLIGNKNPIGKKIRAVLPELKHQGILEILDHVYQTGIPYIGKETPVALVQENGQEEVFYLNFNYKTYTNNAGKIDGILVFAYDITEQILARGKISESERRYRVLIDSLPIAVYTTDINGYIKIYNEKAINLWGGSPKVGVDKWCGNTKVYNADGQLLSLEEYPMLQILEEKNLLVTELIIENEDHIKTNIINYAKIKKDADGNIIGAINSLVDISDYKNAVKKMRRNVEMMNEMYQSSPAFVCILKGKEFTYDYVNPSYQNLYGRMELIGKPLKEVHPELDNQEIYEILDQVYETGTTYVATEMPLYLSRDEGKAPEPVFLNFSYQPIYDLESEVEGIMVFGYDVTRQVLAKLEKDENIKEILEFLPVMIWTNLTDGTVNFLNKKWNDFTNLDNNFLNTFSWRNLIHPEDITKTLRAYKHSILNGNSFEIEVRFLRASDHTYRWHITQALPIFNQNNEIELWIGIATDIQDQKVKEQKKDDFISIASHEMKTPITTAKAYLQLLKQTPPNDLVQSDLYKQKATIAIDKLSRLITELLNISKIQNGKLDLSISSFDFNEFIETSIENVQMSSLKHTIFKKGVINTKVEADPEKLQQVVINLLGNAIKYSPNSDKVEVEVKEEEEMVIVAIRDYGVGIDKSNNEKIFDRYFRIDEHSLQFQGLGIGLYISREIIKLHNGEIWAESEDIGSTFYFKIPLTYQKVNEDDE